MTSTVEQTVRTDAGLASVLRISVMRLGRRLRNERSPDNELTVAGMSVLGVLMRVGEQTLGQLAAHERVQPPSMTRTVNCLVEDGFAVRRPSETDGRQVLIALSDKGRNTIQADRKRRDAWLNQQLEELTHEERELLRKVTPLIERLATA